MISRRWKRTQGPDQPGNWLERADRWLKDRLLFLDLTDTNITDECVEHLSGLTMLTQLKLAGTKVTAAKMDALAALPALENLWLDAAVADAALPMLKQSKSLTALHAVNSGKTRPDGSPRKVRAGDKLVVFYW